MASRTVCGATLQDAYHYALRAANSSMSAFQDAHSTPQRTGGRATWLGNAQDAARKAGLTVKAQTARKLIKELEAAAAFLNLSPYTGETLCACKSIYCSGGCDS